jgi:hypothetical protein
MSFSQKANGAQSAYVQATSAIHDVATPIALAELVAGVDTARVLALLQNPVVRAAAKDFLRDLWPTAPESASAHVKRTEYARMRGVSDATVSRWVELGMPVVPVGSTYRIEPAAADEWRRRRGRVPTTPAARLRPAEEDVDVGAALARSGLRAIGGAR